MKYYLWTAAAAFALVICAHGQANERPAGNPPSGGMTDAVPTAGRTLFLKNCAHCHAADAHGDEGPDLHNIDWTDEQIAKRIRTGKKGQMTAFEGKLAPEDIKTIVAYVKTLK